MVVRFADEFTAPCEVLASFRVGEQSVVSDAHQSGRQDVEQEAAEKLLCVEGHEPIRVASRAVIPSKGHAVVVEGDESVVGDGHAVGNLQPAFDHRLHHFISNVHRLINRRAFQVTLFVTDLVAQIG